LDVRHKDLKLDAVAWRTLDGRPGKTVLLCQCAVGGDWNEKAVHVEQWRKLINFSVPPTPAVAFPFVPEAVRPFSEDDWYLLCGLGMPFDRLRLARLLSTATIEAELLEGVTDWTAEFIPTLQAAL